MKSWPYAKYPCIKTRGVTLTKFVTPSEEMTNMDASSLWGLAQWAMDAVCDTGLIALVRRHR